MRCIDTKPCLTQDDKSTLEKLIKKAEAKRRELSELEGKITDLIDSYSGQSGYVYMQAGLGYAYGTIESKEVVIINAFIQKRELSKIKTYNLD